MPDEYSLYEAKAKLSALVKQVREGRTVIITVHGQPVAVVISQAMYEKLTGNEQSLVKFMRASPLYAMEDIPLERDKSPTRKVSL